MGKTVKATKVGLKDAHDMVDSLKEMIQSDLRKQKSGFEDALSSRLREAEVVILESAKAKLAIVAGVGLMRKDLDRAQRKFSKTNDVEELKNTLIDLSMNLKKLRETNKEVVASLSSVLNPTLSAVEVVERFASDLQRSAGTWERHGREIDDSIMELCQDNQPAEMVELEKYIERQGYSVLLGDAHSSSEESE
ncbi:MAG TPA: hypothetical protein HA356_02105 [Candidatus Poseidoniaceae archaeon]|jgi:hypothetical protein|nr:MAG TPA: hypothetical protein D7H95_02130 [Candidatus Poseidoniales archaeon]HII10851.1 hypothetical protein [Candidatus Poseidoniaceae archaeon]|tara:strand:- start:1860 stop:2438 length:579 start_codon:yes stop_codon:yes gene_type:complete